MRYQIRNSAVATVIVSVAVKSVSAGEIEVVDEVVDEVVVEVVDMSEEAEIIAAVEAVTPVDLYEEVVLFLFFPNNDYNEYLI